MDWNCLYYLIYSWILPDSSCMSHMVITWITVLILIDWNWYWTYSNPSSIVLYYIEYLSECSELHNTNRNVHLLTLIVELNLIIIVLVHYLFIFTITWILTLFIMIITFYETMKVLIKVIECLIIWLFTINTLNTITNLY